jgi:hypothetical protein
MTPPLVVSDLASAHRTKPLTEPWWTELRIFLEVAHARSYHKAAKELGLSHPTVSRAVGRLEEA